MSASATAATVGTIVGYGFCLGLGFWASHKITDKIDDMIFEHQKKKRQAEAKLLSAEEIEAAVEEEMAALAEEEEEEEEHPKIDFNEEEKK
jgi:GTP-sensing pleiotropic transcriptional regulator CodY